MPVCPLPVQEWQGVTIAGRSKAAARGGGHILTVREGGVYMYGGRDALGAQVSHLLRLKRTAGTRWGVAGAQASPLGHKQQRGVDWQGMVRRVRGMRALGRPLPLSPAAGPQV